MTTLSIQPPFPLITDIDGQPLEDGYIWVGTANLPPIGNPIAVYWDAALTIPAALPIRTRGGYPVNAGTPARLYVGSDYSILVQNKNGSMVYSAPVATERYGGGIINAADVVYDPAGLGAVPTTVQAKLRETVSVKDFGAVGDGVADDTQAIQAALNAVGNRVFTSYANLDGSSVSIFHSKQVLIFPPGRYKTTATLLIDQGITLRAPGGHSSAVIEYTGTGNAIVINNTWTGLYNDPQSAQNTRYFRWEGLALNAPNASVGVLIGSATLRYVEFLAGQIINVNGYGIFCGEAVYFMRLGNFEVTNCDVGVYIKDYCDLFTVDDRSAFFSNKTCALLLECPTFHIENVDFEGNRGPVAQVIVRSTSANVTGLRGGLFINNRWGPERTVTTGSGTLSPSPYDVSIEESGGGTIPIISRLKFIGNNFFSRNSGADRKTAPVLLNARVSDLRFNNNIYSKLDYSSGFFVTTTNAVLCGSTGSVWRNVVDDIETVNPTIRGLFAGNARPGYFRVIQANITTTKYSVVYVSSISALAALDGELTQLAIQLATSSSRVNYSSAIGVVTYDSTIDQQQKPIWVAGPGALLQTTLDFTGQPIGSPVYLNGVGSLSLTAPSYVSALIVGRTCNATTNGTIRITLENAGFLFGSATYNPPPLPDGDGATTNVTVTGAALGDFAEASFDQDLNGITLTAWVSAINTVSVRFQNESGGTLDLASATLRVRVRKDS